ncbi:hypothetical protein V6N13_072820 [Hibiscus sabdariffa]|uniref:Large ribosomal subunit protein eL24-related N-terminal domain-containing protein n=1 Tax=Hibiscus sabdariffa TaxID=183260 RepID=A0ABR2E7B3_9ROSI
MAHSELLRSDQHQLQPWFTILCEEFGFHLSSVFKRRRRRRYRGNGHRTELCRFSGAKIYPGKGIRFVRSDSSSSFLIPNAKGTSTTV